MDLDCAEPTLLNATELEQEVKAVPVVTSVSTKPTEKDYFKRKADHRVTTCTSCDCRAVALQ